MLFPSLSLSFAISPALVLVLFRECVVLVVAFRLVRGWMQPAGSDRTCLQTAPPLMLASGGLHS